MLLLFLSLATTLATPWTSDSCQSQTHSDHVSITGVKAASNEEFKGHGECLESSKNCEYGMIDRQHSELSCMESANDCQGELGIKNRPTSVWCQSSSEFGLRCRFENLLYNAKYKEFIFVLSAESIINGIKNLRHLEELYLSSVKGHNAFQIKLSIVPLEEDFRNSKVEVIKEKTLLLGRFKSDNLLHVFHDDLLPLYFTMRELCPDMKLCRETLNVIFTDEERQGVFWDLYRMFSSKVMKLPDLIPGESEWYCFQEAYIGLNKMSVWYQYGFGRPQGPVVNKEFRGVHLRQFANYVRGRLDVKPFSERRRGVLLSRKSNRKIINEKELSDALQSRLASLEEFQKVKMKVLSLEENDLKMMIEELSEAVLVVGVHGSAMILGMFLAPGSILVEIWPYGIDPDAAKVSRTMCELEGFGVIYVPWVNKDFHNTVYHPEYRRYYGGLSHLQLEERKGIIAGLQEYKLSSLECCDSTDWLFRIYQDTRVHIGNVGNCKSDSILDLVSNGLIRAKSIVSPGNGLNDMKDRIHPGQVQSLECFLDKEGSFTKLYVEWQEPWNARHMVCMELKYEIVLQDFDGEEDFERHEVQDLIFLKKIKLNIAVVDLWVTCFCDNVEGSVAFVDCR